MPKPERKEIYSATLLLLVGTIYLVAQAGSFFSTGSVYIEGDVIKLSKNELLSHLRTIITILLCFSGGILLLRIKRAGWIISQSLFLLLLAILVGILVSNFSGLSGSMLVLTGGIVLLLLAILFLFQKQTREKFMITGKHTLSAIILFLALAAFYFFLQ